MAIGRGQMVTPEKVRLEPSFMISAACCRVMRLLALMITSCSVEILQYLSGDDHPLDLVGPLVDGGDPGIPGVALHREVPGVAIPPQHLQRLVAGPVRRLGGIH